MTYLLFLTALGLSAVAAYYSIMGLVAIFAAAATPIFIMGSLLEVSKLVVASWLYRSWKKIPKLMMAYFTVALVVLMMLTSMGIFGYLSKAHLDQAVPSGDVAAKLSLIDEKIKTEKENIDASRKAISQLDAQVDQTISRTTDSNGADRAVAIRRGQQKERARLLAEIGEAQTKVAKLNEERAPIASEVRKVEAEVGPIKYIAALIYEESASEEVLEKAVRIVIMMIVLVFDPLAVLLLIAANWQMRHEETKHPLEFFKQFEKKQMRIDDFVPQPKEFVVEKQEGDSDELWRLSELPTQEEGTTPTNTSEETVTEEPLVVEVDEPKKDWEPELYHRKELGRYESELLENSKPEKTKSFLAKADTIIKAPGVTTNTIEHDVENLQK